MNYHHEIIVGNIGSVYRGAEFKVAQETFAEYVDQSKNCSGRAAGEPVTWLRDGDIYKEHEGSAE